MCNDNRVIISKERDCLKCPLYCEYLQGCGGYDPDWVICEKTQAYRCEPPQPTDTDKAFKLACKFMGTTVSDCPVGVTDNSVAWKEHRDCDNICNNMDVKKCWEAYFRWKVTR